jgi:hypothetical protein
MITPSFGEARGQISMFCQIDKIKRQPMPILWQREEQSFASEADKVVDKIRGCNDVRLKALLELVKNGGRARSSLRLLKAVSTIYSIPRRAGESAAFYDFHYDSSILRRSVSL